MFVEIRGDTTGRVWRYHQVLDRLEVAGSGVRFRATATDDGSLACLHQCEKGGYWDDEFDRLRVALEIAALPEVTTAPYIRQLIDRVESDAGTGEFGPLVHLSALWEWADISLDEFLHDPDQHPAGVAESVDENIGAALDALHGAGFVHLDVAPNNILRVEGVWKLADLDSCARRGEPAIRRPVNKYYVHPDRGGEIVPARDEFDSYGLERVLIRLRS